VAFPRIASTAIRLPATFAPPLENPTDWLLSFLTKLRDAKQVVPVFPKRFSNYPKVVLL
jgi:hypothetical protein